MLAADSWAVLTHLYTFNNANANDTAPGGTAHGTLEGGALIIAGTVGAARRRGRQRPGAIRESARREIAINTYSALTFEIWLNSPVLNNNGEAINFSMAAAFGREGTPDDATTTVPPLVDDPNEDIFGHDYVMIQPTRGGNGTGRIAITDDYFNSETGVNGAQMRGRGQTHIVATVSSTGPNATTITYYVDGVQTGNPATGEDDLSDVSNEVAYLGRSLYDGDAYFAGTINEFRIHNNALTLAEVQASFATGPAGAAGPTVTVNRSTGAVSLSNPNTAARIVSYSIDSPVGALDPVDWAEVTGRVDAPPLFFGTGDGSFDADDLWNVTASTANTLAEATGVDGIGADDGASLGSVALGTGVWEKYYIEDVRATVRVRNAAFDEITIPVDVVFTGNGGQAFRRSDLNFDGQISGPDWVLFRANAGTTQAGMSDVQSYPSGDIDGDQDNDFLDFRLFQADFDAANGTGALAAIAAVVPEPSATFLMLTGLGSLVGARRRRTR